MTETQTPRPLADWELDGHTWSWHGRTLRTLRGGLRLVDLPTYPLPMILPRQEEAIKCLIAAAPETARQRDLLLEACRDVQSFLRRSGYDTRIMDAALAACTKEDTTR